MIKPLCRLENWQVVFGKCLAGNIYNSPTFEPGVPVVTSDLINIDFEALRAETINTIYYLGKPYVTSATFQAKGEAP